MTLILSNDDDCDDGDGAADGMTGERVTTL